MHGHVVWCMESGEGSGVATLHHHEGMPVQAEADGWVNRNDLPGCSCDSERKGRTRKGAIATAASGTSERFFVAWPPCL